MALNDFDYELVHRDGKRNAGPDHLSRNPIDSTQPYGEEPTEIDPHPILALTTSPDTAQAACTLDASSKSTSRRKRTSAATSSSSTNTTGKSDEPATSAWDIPSPFTGKAPFFKGGDEHPRTAEEWIQLQGKDATCQRIRA